jgi:hypothetical protein
MSWAFAHVAKLRSGETVQFRPVGNSMRGRIESGQLVTVEPFFTSQTATTEPNIGDIVLCLVKGRHFLHIVKDTRGGVDTVKQYLIGNNRGGINGWVERCCLFGRVVRVQP